LAERARLMALLHTLPVQPILELLESGPRSEALVPPGMQADAMSHGPFHSLEALLTSLSCMTRQVTLQPWKICGVASALTEALAVDIINRSCQSVQGRWLPNAGHPLRASAASVCLPMQGARRIAMRTCQ